MFQKIQLNEDTRAQLLSRSKSADKEKDNKTRYEKRLKSKVKANISNLNKIDFNQLFKNNIMTVSLDVQGETDNYTVTISFGGFLDDLKKQLKQNNNELSLRIVIRALLDSFNSDNVYIRCSCDDFKYRHAYYLSKDNIIAGDKETRPSNITNPNNSLGRGCKHIMLVISNTSWIIKLGSVVFNYYNYMKIHYKKMWADIIYPAIWGKEYEEPIQLDIDTINKNNLDTDTATIDNSNIEARDRGKFKKDNKLGIRFAPKQQNINKNMSFLDLDNENGEEIR